MTLTPLEQVEALSVVQHPDPGKTPLRFGSTFTRGPLLAPVGSRERELQLRNIYHHDYNTLFTSAIAGLIKRVQSTPWEIRAEDPEEWQALLMNADFGDWDRFISKLVTDYSRHDSGAWIEHIAPGDPTGAPIGPVAGLAILDSLRCYPTGNPEHPVIYYDSQGRMHQLHRSRVVQFVDSPDSEEALAGYGKCALSRAIAPINREILSGRYIEQFLDDKPPPGVAVFRNLTEEELIQAVNRMDNERGTDAGSVWGQVIKLYGLQAEHPVEVDFISYTKAPEKFDFEGYTVLDVRQIALAIGLDINDMWELTGSSLGTGTQSQIMAQKSRGKAFGRILKGLERVINRALPPDAEFVWQYKDPQEDIEEAQKAQTNASTVNLMTSDLTTDERRQYLANQIPALGDVMRDEDGTVRRLPDDDPKPEGEDVAVTADTESVEGAEKAFADTASQFGRTFAGFVRMAQRGDTQPGVLRAVMRDFLSDAGTMAYLDGLEEGGTDPEDADSVELAQRRRKIAAWLASQDAFISKFVDELINGGIEDVDIPRRADLWVSRSLRGAYYMGLADADALVLKRWRLGKTEKHCDTCLTLNGQVHTLKEYIDSGFFPGSARLACGGYYCDCGYDDVPRGTRRQGTLPGSTSSSLFDRLLGFFRGLTGGR